jgi:hypothetical protein
MKRTRINFNNMNYDEFIGYLKNRKAQYDELDTTTLLGLNVIAVQPKQSRMTSRVFDKNTGHQLDSKLELTGIDFNQKKTLARLIKIIDDKINNMSTKGVYHPRRLQPKWQSLTSNKQKLDLFRRYMTAPTSSIGFLRLINCNLPSKTLESIIIDYPEFESLIAIDRLRQKCIDKFKLYDSGKDYLRSKQLL